jgi:mycofactocin precursor
MMADQLTADGTDETGDPAPGTALDTEIVEDELLIEEVSIDGMCGVY